MAMPTESYPYRLLATMLTTQLSVQRDLLGRLHHLHGRFPESADIVVELESTKQHVARLEELLLDVRTLENQLLQESQQPSDASNHCFLHRREPTGEESHVASYLA